MTLSDKEPQSSVWKLSVPCFRKKKYELVFYSFIIPSIFALLATGICLICNTYLLFLLFMKVGERVKDIRGENDTDIL